MHVQCVFDVVDVSEMTEVQDFKLPDLPPLQCLSDRPVDEKEKEIDKIYFHDRWERKRKEAWQKLTAVTCTICPEAVSNGADIVRTMDCGHLFHRGCIVECLRKNAKGCPNCRRTVQALESLKESTFLPGLKH